MTTPNPTPDEKRRILASYLAAGEEDQALETIFDNYLNGVKGYKQMSDDEVETEWEEMMGDMSPDELQEIIDEHVA